MKGQDRKGMDGFKRNAIVGGLASRVAIIMAAEAVRIRDRMKPPEPKSDRPDRYAVAKPEPHRKSGSKAVSREEARRVHLQVRRAEKRARKRGG